MRILISFNEEFFIENNYINLKNIFNKLKNEKNKIIFIPDFIDVKNIFFNLILNKIKNIFIFIKIKIFLKNFIKQNNFIKFLIYIKRFNFKKKINKIIIKNDKVEFFYKSLYIISFLTDIYISKFIIKNIFIEIKKFFSFSKNIKIYKFLIKKNNFILLEPFFHKNFLNYKKNIIKISDIIILIIYLEKQIKKQIEKLIKYIKKFKNILIIKFININIKNNKIKYIINNIIKINLLFNYKIKKIFLEKMYLNFKNNNWNTIKKIFLFSNLIKKEKNSKENFLGLVIENKFYKKNIKIIIKSGKIQIGNKIYFKNKWFFLKNFKIKKNNILKINIFSKFLEIGDILIILNKKFLKTKYIINNKLFFKNENKKFKKLFKFLFKIKKFILNIIIKSDSIYILKIIKEIILKNKFKIIKISIKNKLKKIKKKSIKKNLKIIYFNKKINKKSIEIYKKKKNKIYYFNKIYKLIKYLKKFAKNNKNNKIKITAILYINNFYFISNKNILNCNLEWGFLKINSKIIISREKKNLFKNKILFFKNLKNKIDYLIILKKKNKYLKGDIIKIYENI